MNLWIWICSVCVSWLFVGMKLCAVQMIGQFIHCATLRHTVTVVIRLFPVLRQLRAVKPDFDITLEVGAHCVLPRYHQQPVRFSFEIYVACVLYQHKLSQELDQILLVVLT